MVEAPAQPAELAGLGRFRGSFRVMDAAERPVPVRLSPAGSPSPRAATHTRLTLAIEPHRGSPTEALPASQDDIDIERVELERRAAPAGPLSGDEGRARASEDIEDEGARGGAVRDGPLHEAVEQPRPRWLPRAANRPI